jgi:hypothetical protein
VQNREVVGNPGKARRGAKVLGRRLSVSLTQGQHQALLELADMHGVTLAWLARYAIDQFLHRSGRANYRYLSVRTNSETKLGANI